MLLNKQFRVTYLAWHHLVFIAYSYAHIHLMNWGLVDKRGSLSPQPDFGLVIQTLHMCPLSLCLSFIDFYTVDVIIYIFPTLDPMLPICRESKKVLFYQLQKGEGNRFCPQQHQKRSSKKNYFLSWTIKQLLTAFLDLWYENYPWDKPHFKMCLSRGWKQ